MEPLVSVVIPAYNREKQIAKAIQSVQLQTYTNWEMIVVDDGSIDATAKVVDGFAKQDRRIRFIRHNANRGAQAARNTGIRLAGGEWIAFLDSDDEWLPRSLQVRLEKALLMKVAVVHSGSYIIMSEGEIELYRCSQPSGKVYRSILTNECPMFPSLLVSRSALERIGYLDEKIVSFQEWDTFIRLAKYYEFAFVPEPTFVYDDRTQNAISRNTLQAAVGYSGILRKHFFPILVFAGPRALANHYKITASLFEKAGHSELGILVVKRCLHLLGLFSGKFGRRRASSHDDCLGQNNVYDGP
jgi:glycosyltransferase involved in cell wall biosynthesis